MQFQNGLWNRKDKGEMMNQTIIDLLEGKSENHIMPFFWQHGEEEATLREYMAAIAHANCGGVCVESRPHPDFCGPKWWKDMDVILDEARKRNMKVWILDDSHFPTGFANGAVKNAPLNLHRQSLCTTVLSFEGSAQNVTIDLKEAIPPEFRPANMMEKFVIPAMLKDAPHFEDDKILAVTAVNTKTGEAVSLNPPYEGDSICWEKPDGKWDVYVIGLSRNCGPHREYINMLEADSCRLLIDAVYEPHWQHYADDFGKTITGFFSDEPELGNGHMYFYENVLGTEQDLPFADTMPEALAERLGADWPAQMHYLWCNDCDAKETAKVRYAYMDAVTKLLRENFSRQIGKWCNDHGVLYVGHMIEDGNAHARTGSSLGHYFRGLDGQDMSGIDDIGGQVLPQGEDEPKTGTLGSARDGEFYHYMLGSLAASAAAIEPKKKGNAMCEIFGNYGWAEGVQLEKYLTDHFMVRGINYFVPHAFSPAPFPDTDCPPHFYAHGHNPQYRHFGELMRYMNRICTLISGGHRVVQAAVLYHGEAEWGGEAMLSQKPARKLTEAQIAFDVIPADVFAEPEHYQTKLGNPLRINTQEYQVLIIPAAQFLTYETAQAAVRLCKQGFPVFFLEEFPKGIANGTDELLQELKACRVVSLEGLIPELRQLGIMEVVCQPESTCLRVLHYQGKAELYYFVNEADTVYQGTVRIPVRKKCYWYDAWENKIYPADLSEGTVEITLEPRKSLILLADTPVEGLLSEPVCHEGEEMPLGTWKRSVCAGIDYPNFENEKQITLPDALAEECPQFSGYVRYESCFELAEKAKVTLEIEEAFEGVEVFVNAISAGIQIVKPYRYDITEFVKEGANTLCIEVATTLERYCYHLTKDDIRSKFRGVKEPHCGSGITGRVKLYKRGNDEYEKI